RSWPAVRHPFGCRPPHAFMTDRAAHVAATALGLPRLCRRPLVAGVRHPFGCLTPHDCMTDRAAHAAATALGLPRLCRRPLVARCQTPIRVVDTSLLHDGPPCPRRGNGPWGF